MKLIAPTPVTDAVLVSSTVAEDDHPEWSAVTAYAVGDKVIVAAAHKAYEALTAHTNKPPGDNPADWLDLGATNRWRMFDDKVGTVTSAAETMTIVLAPGICTAVALLNVSALSARIVMTSPTDGVVHDETRDLYDPVNVVDWYAYFFDEIRYGSTALALGLPTYRDATVSITLTGAEGSTVACGACVVGRVREYAAAVDYGASIGIQDYSRKERDPWGNFQIVERAFNKRARWRFLLRNADLDALQRQLAELRARPAVYIGADLYDSTVLYGYYRDFDVVIAYPMHSECSIEIEGMI